MLQQKKINTYVVTTSVLSKLVVYFRRTDLAICSIHKFSTHSLITLFFQNFSFENLQQYQKEYSVKNPENQKIISNHLVYKLTVSISTQWASYIYSMGHMRLGLFLSAYEKKDFLVMYLFGLKGFFSTSWQTCF